MGDVLQPPLKSHHHLLFARRRLDSEVRLRAAAFAADAVAESAEAAALASALAARLGQALAECRRDLDARQQHAVRVDHLVVAGACTRLLALQDLCDDGIAVVNRPLALLATTQALATRPLISDE